MRVCGEEEEDEEDEEDGTRRTRGGGGEDEIRKDIPKLFGPRAGTILPCSTPTSQSRITLITLSQHTPFTSPAIPRFPSPLLPL